jgi:Zinc finger, C2H2 type
MCRTVSRMSKYVRNEAGEYLCPHCPFTAKAKNPSTMHYHLKAHSGETKYACTQCDKKFIQKSGLTQHMAQVHVDDGCSGSGSGSGSDTQKKIQTCWTCKLCQHVAKTKANMMIHIGRIHGKGWIPPLNDGCSKCSKKFNSAGAYFYHATTCFEPTPEVAAAIAAITVAAATNSSYITDTANTADQ